MPEREGGSSLIAYAKVGLWDGELEGIINTDEKFYSLRTTDEPIKVESIKFGKSTKTLMQDNQILNDLIPTGTTAKIGLEYKGNTLDNNQDNSYFRAFIDIEANEEKLKDSKIGDASFPIKIKKLALGYLKYGKDSEVNNSDFRKWLEDEKKEVAEMNPKSQVADDNAPAQTNQPITDPDPDPKKQ